MKLQGKRVVVLGGNGFIGSRLIDHLAAQDAEVVSFDLNPPQAPTSDIQYLIGDFFDTSQLLSAVEGADCIVHAVSTINPGTSQTQYLRGYTRDFAQTAVLCDYAWKHQQRLLFLSSGGTVYGQKDTPMKEDDPKCPINHYGSVKLCIETMMQTFMQIGADFHIARIANPFGPGQDFEKGVGFVDAAVKCAINHVPLEIWGDGSIVRDYIFIDDVCHMLMDVMKNEGIYRIFNIGSGIGIGQMEIVQMLQKGIGQVEVRFLPRRTIDVPQVVLDTSRYRSQFMFRPRTFVEGLNSYVAWLRNMRHTS